MREKRNFAERTKALRSDEVRKKYFLVYEGKDTELLYFDAVNELRREIKINPLMKGLIPQLCWGEWSKQERVRY